MPKAASIAYTDVERIANQMVQTGTEPTVAKVIAAHGSGSATTVTPMLREWHLSRPSRTADFECPERIQQAIAAEIQRAATAAMEPLQKDLGVANENIQTLVSEGNQRAADLDETASQLTVADTTVKQQRGTIEQLREQLAVALSDGQKEREMGNQHRIELTKAQLRLEALPGLEKQVAQLRADLTAEKAASATANQNAAVLKAERDAATKELAAESDRIKGLQAHLDKAHQNTETIRAQHTEEVRKLTEDLDKAKDGLRDVAIEKARLEDSAAHAKKEAAALKVEAEKLHRALDAAKKKAAGNKTET